MTKKSPRTTQSKTKDAERLAEAERKADEAKATAKAAKSEVKEARQRFKTARRAAKVAKKAFKKLRSEYAESLISLRTRRATSQAPKMPAPTPSSVPDAPEPASPIP